MANNDDKKVKKKDASPKSDHSEDADIEKELGELTKKLEEVDQKRDEAVRIAQRAQADYVNLKRRFEKDREDIGRFAAEAMLMQILPAIDNLDRAIHYASAEEQSSSLFMGVKMTLQQFHDALVSMGVTKAEVKPGDVFDPNLHEAVELVEGDKDKVIEILQTAYVMGDKVVRVARVKVGKG